MSRSVPPVTKTGTFSVPVSVAVPAPALPRVEKKMLPVIAPSKANEVSLAPMVSQPVERSTVPAPVRVPMVSMWLPISKTAPEARITGSGSGRRLSPPRVKLPAETMSLSSEDAPERRRRPVPVLMRRPFESAPVISRSLTAPPSATSKVRLEPPRST